jgi:hypothetical protein
VDVGEDGENGLVLPQRRDFESPESHFRRRMEQRSYGRYPGNVSLGWTVLNYIYKLI